MFLQNSLNPCFAQCNSKHDKIAGDCESEPPPPSTCYGSTDSQRYCVTIREINAAGNKQHAYINSVTTNKESA